MQPPTVSAAPAITVNEAISRLANGAGLMIGLLPDGWQPGQPLTMGNVWPVPVPDRNCPITVLAGVPYHEGGFFYTRPDGTRVNLVSFGF